MRTHSPFNEDWNKFESEYGRFINSVAYRVCIKRGVPYHRDETVDAARGELIERMMHGESPFNRDSCSPDDLEMKKEIHRVIDKHARRWHRRNCREQSYVLDCAAPLMPVEFEHEVILDRLLREYRSRWDDYPQLIAGCLYRLGYLRKNATAVNEFAQLILATGLTAGEIEMEINKMKKTESGALAQIEHSSHHKRMKKLKSLVAVLGISFSLAGCMMLPCCEQTDYSAAYSLANVASAVAFTEAQIEDEFSHSMIRGLPRLHQG